MEGENKLISRETSPTLQDRELLNKSHSPQSVFSIDSILSQKMLCQENSTDEPNQNNSLPEKTSSRYKIKSEIVMDGNDKVENTPMKTIDGYPISSGHYPSMTANWMLACSCSSCDKQKTKGYSSYPPLKDMTSRMYGHLYDRSVYFRQHPRSFSEASTNNHNESIKEDDHHNKRRRTIFTTSQLERLEFEFQQEQYIVGQERRYLARELGLNEIQVKVWFQNRRIKWRKYTHDYFTPTTIIDDNKILIIESHKDN